MLISERGVVIQSFFKDGFKSNEDGWYAFCSIFSSGASKIKGTRGRQELIMIQGKIISIQKMNKAEIILIEKESSHDGMAF